MNCKNCSTQLTDGTRFCPHCGQSVVNYNKPLKPVFMDMLHEAMDIDGRLWRTLKSLMLKPGALSVAYRDGQRARYTPPLRLYLVISILFFLVLPLMDPAGQVLQTEATVGTDLYPKIMFVLLPFFALLLHVLFRGTFYLSNLVLALHIHCITYLVLALILPLEANEHLHPILIALQIPLVIYLLGYLVLALKRYYALAWGQTVLRLLVMLLVYASVLGIAFDYVLLKLTS